MAEGARSGGRPDPLEGVDAAQLRTLYDGQLKKLLAYIAIAVSSAYPNVNLFLDLGNRQITYSPLPATLLATASYAGMAYFSIGALTKYQEIALLESRMGLTEAYLWLYAQRPAFGRLWDRAHRRLLKIEESSAPWPTSSRMRWVLDLAMAALLVGWTLLYLELLSRVS